jgi:WD40 repeat protein/pimeloyl-ACP methyl ester carboxylesterase
MNTGTSKQSSQQRNSPGQQSVGSIQRRFESLKLRRPSTQSPEDDSISSEKTRIGLTELHSPSDPRIDFIFVHGLRGGSFKTWRKYDDPRYFWPKAWISEDRDLYFVRTFTFGYRSDWLSLRESILNVNDFGRKLLGELQTSRSLRQSKDTPIVFIGHSMGGLVIKKAYMLARLEAPDLAHRIKAMVFLATPHRGSDSADLLHSILEVTGSDKQYVNDLMKSSPSLEAINDEFPNYVDELEIWSFFEERKMRTGVRSDFVVGKASATLQLPKERKFSLNANHREICKFESPDDENYVVLRNALVTIVDKFTTQGDDTSADCTRIRRQTIKLLLKVSDTPSDDLDEQRTMQIPGTCEWINDKHGFEEWIYPPIEGQQEYALDVKQQPRIELFVLQARAGTGKSVCSAHVISTLQESDQDCSYFFFHHGIKQKTLLSTMLQEIAFQMSEQRTDVREALQKLSQVSCAADKDNEFIIWDRIFVGCIFKLKSSRRQYWILDGLDECSAPEAFLKMIQKTQSGFPLRIFITARPQPTIDQQFLKLGQVHKVWRNSISDEDTVSDMQRYLVANDSWQDLVAEDDRDAFRDTLLRKSNGCFLWLKLVCRELEVVYSQESVEVVLNEIPVGLEALYARSLAQMAKAVREQRLLETILTWAVCAVRPLKVGEFESALRNEFGFSRGLRQSIDRLCGNLLYVDVNDCVQLVHSTIRDFLFNADPQLPYSIKREQGHEILAMACLKVMEKEMRPPRSRSFGRELNMAPVERSALVRYAATGFSEHITASSSVSDQLLLAIAKFLKSSILAWIEHIASTEPSLYYLTRTATNMKQYLERRAKHLSPLGTEFKLVQDWATDLLRLVAKFGRNLQQQPSSIYFLLPSLAPRDSQLYLQSLNSPKWLEVKGAAATSWDDCIASIEYRDTYATALGYGRSHFAVGMKNGMVILHDQSTCQEVRRVQLKQPSSSTSKLSSVIRLIAFDSRNEKIAACGAQSISVWSLFGEILHFFELHEPLVAMQFSMDAEYLITVSRSSRVVYHSLKRAKLDLDIPTYPQRRRRSSGYYNVEGLQLPRQAPLAAAISPDQTTLAILFRGQPIYLYNLEDDTLLGTCGRDVDSDTPNISVLTAIFNPNPDMNLLVVSHQDGDLALFDPWTQKELRSVYGDAYSLAASPNGQFLGTGNTRGTVRLWEFETLSLLYVIHSGLEEVRSLVFTGDGTRIVDRRDSRVKVWEPVALIRRSNAEEDSGSLSDATTLAPLEVGENEEELTVTAICFEANGRLIYAGRSDGSVVAYNAKEGSLIATIQKEGGGEFVVAIGSGADILAAADSGQGVKVWRTFQSLGEGHFEASLLLHLTLEEPIQQLLLSADGFCILVVTSRSEELWDVLQRRQINVTSNSGNRSGHRRRWASMGSEVVALSHDWAVELYNWTLSPVLQHSVLRASFAGDSQRDSFEITALTFSKSSRYLIATLAQAHPGASAMHLLTMDNPFGDLTVSDSQVSLDPIAQKLPQSIRCFIGCYQEKIVFLDHDLWICSVDLAESATTGSVDIRRHVFVPPDFVGGSTVAAPIVTPQGYVVFSREGNLAIVQGALNFTFS